MSLIKIPTTLKSNYEGFTFLAELLPRIKDGHIVGQELLVDFSLCSSIHGNLAAVLGAILDKAVPMVGPIRIILPFNKTVGRVLSRNHFFKAWKAQSSYEEKENYVEYRRFKSDASADEFKTYIDEGLVKKQKFPQHTNLAGDRIVESIFEIYVNAVAHGKTDYVYSCGEYIVDRHILEMTIVDCGQTIPGNVNEYLARKNCEIVGDCDAIEWAFVSGNTTKDQTGGLGLAIIKEFIELNKGSIQVVSGCGFIEYCGDSVERFLLNTPFPGTVVNMKFNFDDNKHYSLKSEQENIDLNDLL